MRKVYSNKISQAIFMSSAIFLDLVGIIGHIVSIIINNDPVAIYAPIIVFPLLSLIFCFGYYVEKSSTVEMDNLSIIFHYFVFSKPKIKYNTKKGLLINFDNIKEFYTEFHKGDMFYSADTTFYYIILNDDTKIEFGLFRLGKKNEKEIYEILQNVCNNDKIRK